MSMLNTEKQVKEIRRHTRRKFLSEGKIRIVLNSRLISNVHARHC